MKLSTRGRYAMRALLDLALHQDEEPVLLRNISQRQQIPQQYLEHLITPLVSGGLVRSIRGPKGGVMLARPPADIKLSDIIQMAEGPFIPAECVNHPEACEHSGQCATRDILEEMKQAMDGVLESTTLLDMVERQKSKESPEQAMYYI